MFRSPRRGFDHSGIDLCCVMHGNDHAMHSHCLRTAQKGSEVVDILNGIKNEQKRVFVFSSRIIYYLLKRRILTRFNYCQATLVDRPLAELVKTLARHGFDGNLALLSLVKNGSNSRCITLTICY